VALTPRAGGSRRIDKVLAEDFLSGLEGVPLPALREMRAEVDQEEVDLSYLRRMLQGRLDIVWAERAVRASGEPGEGLVAALPQILADGAERQPAQGLGRHRPTEPSRVGETRRREEALLADLGLADPAELDAPALEHAADVLTAEEHEVSTTRRQVQAVLDAINGEIGRRYRTGEATVATLLEGSAPSAG